MIHTVSTTQFNAITLSKPHNGDSMSLDYHPRNRHSVLSHDAAGTTQVRTVLLHGVPIVTLLMNGHERLCLAQISNTLLKGYR